MHRLIIITLFLLSTLCVNAKNMSTQKLMTNIFTNFENAKYEEVIKTLARVEKRVNKKSKKGKELKGLIYYWRAMCYSRLNEYDNAQANFQNAIKLKYNSQDLFYEYGQVLYVQDKYRKARVAFKKSLQKGFKKAVSLYYIGFISQELKDFKKAVHFYNMIERLDDEQKAEVVQAARMQIGDIYLERVEKMPDTFKAVEKYVIPQYELALSWDKDSKLAPDIKQKILSLQRKYELLLFKMRNGRPTANPPYYFKASVLYGINDNVNVIDEESKKSLNEQDYLSNYSTLSFFSRYSFYPNSTFSYAPEFSGSYTKYSSDSDSIIINDNYFWKAALKTNFEHIYKNSPATFYIDLDYTYNADDADADKNMSFSSTSMGITFSEELQIWKNNPSTFRYGYTSKEAELSTSSTTAHSFTYEQLISLDRLMLFSYNNFSLTRYTDAASSSSLDANAFILRVDAIFPTLWNLFNPTVYGSYTSTNYIENSDKGVTSLVTYGLNLNRPLWGKLYLTFDISLAQQTGLLDTDTYNQQITTFNIDYIY